MISAKSLLFLYDSLAYTFFGMSLNARRVIAFTEKCEFCTGFSLVESNIWYTICDILYIRVAFFVRCHVLISACTSVYKVCMSVCCRCAVMTVCVLTCKNNTILSWPKTYNAQNYNFCCPKTQPLHTVSMDTKEFIVSVGAPELC